jgi:hypothetical protein
MKCGCGGGGRELPQYHEIRNKKLGFLRISIPKLSTILFLNFENILVVLMEISTSLLVTAQTKI